MQAVSAPDAVRRRRPVARSHYGGPVSDTNHRAIADRIIWIDCEMTGCP